MPWKMSLGSISGIYRCFSTSALETRRPSSLSTPDCQTGHVLKAPSPSLSVRSLLIHISAIIMSAPCSWPQLGTGLRPASSAQRNEKETLRAKGSQRAIFFVLCSCKGGGCPSTNRCIRSVRLMSTPHTRWMCTCACLLTPFLLADHQKPAGVKH